MSRGTRVAVAGAVLVVLGVVVGFTLFGGDDDTDETQQFERQAARHLPTPREGANGVKAEPIPGRYDEPVGLVSPPGVGDPLFVLERQGRVWRVSDGRKRPFLDLSREVESSHAEDGLLGMAFAPGRGSRSFYVYFVDRRSNIRLQEFDAPRSPEDTVELGTRRQVLHVRHPSSRPGTKPRDHVHYAGQLQFGPDRMLYVAIGDGGPTETPTRRAQSLRSLFGKIVRIDPRPSGSRPYSVPRDNPFVGRSNARPEIYSYGLRNPFRFSFDERRNIWIGDVAHVGQEEIDFAPLARARGANFGWPCFEGRKRVRSCAVSDYVPPAVTRARPSPECASIIGGYVVRDRSLKSLAGRYLYTDLCDGRLRTARADGSRVVDDRPVGFQLPWTASFGEDGLGRVYAVGYLNGRVWRLIPQ